MSAYERRLLRKEINRKLYIMSNKESQENDFLNSSQLITERQHMHMIITKHFREQENKRTSKKRIPFPIESTSLPHVNLGRTNRLLNLTKAITSKSEEVNKVLDAHSYRTATPYYTNPELTVERGNFMNYSQHVGTLLHTPRYIEFLNSFRESKSSNSEKRSNNDFVDSVSCSSLDHSSNSKKTFRSSQSSNSSTSSNKTLENKYIQNTENYHSVSLSRELSSASLNMSISNAESSTFSNDKKVPSKRSSSVLSPSGNHLKDSSINEGRINSSRMSREKRTNNSRNFGLSNKSNNDTISQTSVKSEKEDLHPDLSFHNKNEIVNDVNNVEEDFINNDNRKSIVSKASNERIDSSNETELSTDLTTPDKGNQSPYDKNVASKEIEQGEDLKENVTGAYENDETSNQTKADLNKSDQNMSPNTEKSTIKRSNFEEPDKFEQEVYFSQETKNGLSITNKETNLCPKKMERTEVLCSDDEMFHFEMDDKSKTNFMSKMEEFLNNNDFEPDEVHLMKSYFETIFRFQITNLKYVKDYYKFSAKHNKGSFITFAKICNKHPVHSLNQDEVRRITDLIEKNSIINSADKKNESRIKNKSVDILEIPNGENAEEINSRFESSQNDKIQNDMINKDTNNDEEVKSEKGENKEIENENLCFEENVTKDEDEDFSEAFEKLFRYSIAEISKEDLEAIKRLAENYKESKNDFNDMDNNSEVLLNDHEQPQENSVSNCNDIQKDEKLVEHVSRKYSKDDIKEQNETTNNETVIKNEFIEHKETDSERVNEEIKSTLLEDNNIESEEENEILRNFRNLFRTSIDNIKDKDLEKVNQIIEAHEKQYKYNTTIIQ